MQSGNFHSLIVNPFQIFFFSHSLYALSFNLNPTMYIVYSQNGGHISHSLFKSAQLVYCPKSLNIHVFIDRRIVFTKFFLIFLLNFLSFKLLFHIKHIQNCQQFKSFLLWFFFSFFWFNENPKNPTLTFLIVCFSSYFLSFLNNK